MIFLFIENNGSMNVFFFVGNGNNQHMLTPDPISPVVTLSTHCLSRCTCLFVAFSHCTLCPPVAHRPRPFLVHSSMFWARRGKCTASPGLEGTHAVAPYLKLGVENRCGILSVHAMSLDTFFFCIWRSTIQADICTPFIHPEPHPALLFGCKNIQDDSDACEPCQGTVITRFYFF